MSDQLLLIGWKDITKALGLRTERMAKQWVKRFDIPIKYMGRRPTILAEALNEWFDNVGSNVKSNGFVYFIYCKQTERIKIGFSFSPERRLRDLSRQSPVNDLKLLRVINGTPKDENRLHKKFNEYRHHGEWFEFAPKIMKFIENL